MTRIDFKNCLIFYKELKQFLVDNFDLEEYDTFDIRGGVLTIYRYCYMSEFREEEIPLKDILSKIDKDIIF